MNISFVFKNRGYAPEFVLMVKFIHSFSVLMLTKGTAIQKSFLVPLFALQAPTTVISWIK